MAEGVACRGCGFRLPADWPPVVVETVDGGMSVVGSLCVPCARAGEVAS